MTTIAVIDDDPAFIDFMHDALEYAGHQMLSAASSREGYDLIVAHWPAAVVLDIRMEHPQAGLVLLDLLRGHQRARHIPVIVCTADMHVLQERQERLERKGVQILRKPFTLDQLQASLAAAMRRTAPLAEALSGALCLLPRRTAARLDPAH